MWHTKTKLMNHQAAAVAKILPLKVGALFMEMGTGKTRTAIELAKLRWHKVSKLVWVCPVTTKNTILNQFLTHTSLRRDEILVFDNKTNTNTKSLNDFKVVILGIESLSDSIRCISAFNSIVDEQTFVVMDESTYIKNSFAKRSKRLSLISRKAKYRLILTGTSMTQGAVDLYAQMEFLSPKILGYVSFYSFAKEHLIYRQEKNSFGEWIDTKHIIAERNTDRLARKIALYSYQVTKKECVDLPSKIYSSFEFDLSDEQKAASEKAKLLFAERILNLRNDVSSPSIAIFKLFSDLQSISCGFWQGAHLTHKRLDTLLDIVATINIQEKVVIWAKYHYCLNQICSALKASYGDDTVYQYHGKMSEKQRVNSLEKWQKSGRFIVATQASGGHGLNELVVANNVIFYANGFKYSERLQAEDRTHRIGQKNACWYGDIHASEGIDEKIKESLNSKGNTLKIFMDKMNEYRIKGLKQEMIDMVMSEL